MLVAGHNISTTEVESALVSHRAVAEAAVVGRKDELTGQAIAAFVTLRAGEVGDDKLLHRRTAGPCGCDDRADCQTEEHCFHRRSAQDAIRKDHAKVAEGHLRGTATR